MKKLILSLTLAGAAALAAKASTVSSANTFGVLKVDSNTAQTIIAVPWVEVGAGTDPIKVANLVMTSNLTDDDMLYYWNGEKYLAWKLQSGSWKAVNVVSFEGVDVAEPAQNTAVARGKALILVRSVYANKPIYLYGQYQTSADVAPQISANAWNLIAPCNASSAAIDLNSHYNWSKVPAGDYIRVQAKNGIAMTLEYGNISENTQGWGLNVGDAYLISAAAKVQPGQGFWYVSKSNTTPTVTLNN